MGTVVSMAGGMGRACSVGVGPPLLPPVEGRGGAGATAGDWGVGCVDAASALELLRRRRRGGDALALPVATSASRPRACEGPLAGAVPSPSSSRKALGSGSDRAAPWVGAGEEGAVTPVAGVVADDAAAAASGRFFLWEALALADADAGAAGTGSAPAPAPATVPTVAGWPAWSAAPRVGAACPEPAPPPLALAGAIPVTAGTLAPLAVAAAARSASIWVSTAAASTDICSSFFSVFSSRVYTRLEE